MLNRLIFFTQYASRLACAGIVVTSIAGCDGGSSIAGTSTATVPAAPTALAATAGDASASISFSAPGNNGGASITGYQADCTSSGITLSGTNTQSPISLSGLSNGLVYTCTIVDPQIRTTV